MSNKMEEPLTAPIQIHLVDGRYMIFDISVLPTIRQTHRLLGTLIGTLPQIPQQSVFLSLPLELMPEEARYLVDIGAGYVFDSKAAHERTVAAMGDLELRRIRKSWKLGFDVMQEHKRREHEAKQREIFTKKGNAAALANLDKQAEEAAARRAEEEEDPEIQVEPHRLHTQLFPLNTDEPEPIIPEVPASYSVFRYMHSLGYFMSPGLRFGAKYMAYPGDPLRFHSHFLLNHKHWDEEFSVMEIVGGGRLGGGVKKGWMVGGITNEDDSERKEDEVRVFCVEWGGF